MKAGDVSVEILYNQHDITDYYYIQHDSENIKPISEFTLKDASCLADKDNMYM